MNSRSQNNNKHEILSRIFSSDDVKSLPESKLTQLASELRQSLTEVVTDNGGHLASNLGVVELTIALHRVFNTPHDHIIWDVGHQSYVHKILTGRYGEFDTLRKPGGLSGFTCRTESPHDCFGAGHSSTSLSAALGFAEADRLSGSDAFTVAILGDGAFTGGMIHEALNNCNRDLRLIIVINENEMSISKNTGRFASSLAELRSRPGYFQTKKTTGKIIRRIPLIGNPLFNGIRNLKKSLKNLIYGSNYFEDIGLYYIGPIDGNDEAKVETVLREATKLGESVVIHLKTKKGMGYAPAEQQPHLYHSLPPCGKEKPDRTFSSECGRILCAEGAKNPDIVAITAAMSYGTGIECFRKEFPERFFDVGIAEAHALTFAAGLAAAGKRPVAAIYSTFLQRGFDNIIHDIALQNLPVLICIDRAGLNAGDGITHNGIFDVAFLAGLPNVRIYTPATFDALERAIDESLSRNCPCAVRYPADGEKAEVVKAFYQSDSSYCPVRMQADCGDECRVVIISHGRMVSVALQVADILRRSGVAAGVMLLERLTPWNEIAGEVLNKLPGGVRLIVTLEEEIRYSSMGISLCDALHCAGLPAGVKTHVIATSDPFVRPRKGETVYSANGLDCVSVTDEILKTL
ncbi:MAG: 1-deoxy-D-xylulose-5-phosphate synthase [Eubacteriales bacterium]|nr:1-deoxy-D-xylulose-5-phosphate synthase [Eubacteriales bacterium]